MNNITKSLIAGCSLVAATSASAEIETSIHAGYHSNYEFRGVDLGDSLFTAGIDASKDLGGGFTANAGIWYGETFDNGSNDFEEVDYYVGLTKSFGNFDLSIGYTWYDFPGASAGDTSEWYVGASTEIGYGIGLSLTYFRDVDLFDAAYIELAATKSYKLNACTGLDLGVGVAYSDGYNGDTSGGDLDGLNHYYISAALPWEAGSGITVTPYIKYVLADADLVSDLESGNDDNTLLGGVSVSYSF